MTAYWLGNGKNKTQQKSSSSCSGVGNTSGNKMFEHNICNVYMFCDDFVMRMLGEGKTGERRQEMLGANHEV